jgi:hypothetical protein
MLALVGAVALVVALVSILRQQAGVPTPSSHKAAIKVALQSKSDLSPTIANYERAANRSPDGLDDLLTRQWRQRPPPAPIYTASMFAARNSTD